ncbi:hypothetical protein [Campylobacter showae]|uniref:hypothetical protein n=1 Tax=Campylobacter showae TaxID=204 RepID=UPI0026EB176B|nr:hypothetical protein [Campylobacter showae]
MRKILAIFMIFAGINLMAGEKMHNLKIVLKSSNGEATAILDDTAAARSCCTATANAKFKRLRRTRKGR